MNANRRNMKSGLDWIYFDTIINVSSKRTDP